MLNFQPKKKKIGNKYWLVRVQELDFIHTIRTMSYGDT
ncbi:hypothetical protein Pint_22788 [Pistacia integerrima]|uniref:Uncharacterized protein n=1 Tax=Pistacia integerrima TaxID=434235 RepID=A0ACC0YHA1_9ROSI|nr:hypothetical protein Pint_22788 [Pistacia integerrima]